MKRMVFVVGGTVAKGGSLRGEDTSEGGPRANNPCRDLKNYQHHGLMFLK